MKTLIHLLFVSFLAVTFFSCSEPHFLKDEAYRNQVLQDFEQKQKTLHHGNLFSFFENEDLSLAEREALMFLYAYMPIGDIADYHESYYLENVRLSEQIRKEMPWGKTVTDELYRHFVLPIRVNNENLDESREVFYGELKERVKGLSMKDAILEVNHWCHEKVVYRPSDARTSSPLASVKTAYGRCGEESTFTVAALRAVGIPARQVYTPRWAHTDDNHAWVEAWADGEWYFLGACEPEPVLNLGWFNAPASRGMLMHTKVFGRYNGPEEIMLETPNYTEINVIDNYAPTAKAVVTVNDAEGRPVSGAKVEFKVYNYAEFYTVATKYTDAEGRASLTAGKGDMLVWASDKGAFGFSKLSFGKESELALVLDKKEGEAYTIDLDIVPPAEGVNMPEVTPEQRKENDCRLAKEDSIRNAYVATMMTEEQAKDSLARFDLSDNDREDMAKILVASRGNHRMLLAFFKMIAKEKKGDFFVELLRQLSAKDWRDIPGECLLDCWVTLPDLEKMEIRKAAELVNPRVENEMLTGYRHDFLQLFHRDEEAFVEDPARLVKWCKENIEINNEQNSQRIPISPIGVWRTRVADEKSRDIFFVAVARSLGIQAQIDKVTGKVQYVDKEGRTVDVDFAESVSEQSAKGVLRAAYTPIRSLDNPKYYSHFTLSKFKDGAFRLLNYNEGDADMGEGATWANLLKEGTSLDAGYYMLITGTRMASGAVLSKVTFFTINPGQTTTVDLVMRESKEQVQVIGNFNSESLYTPVSAEGTSENQTLLQTCGRGYFVVGVLGVGQEPTNHALRDIAALGSEFEKWGRKMVLLFPSEEQYKKFNPAEFPGLPSTITYGIDIDNGIQQQIAKSMNLSNRNNLPMFIIADTFNRVVFVSQGYTIGLGEQLMKTIHGL
ncbi:transglutaminase domain-containing protein [uncultured Bacteroides sp.]|uniref:transglutaminase domain-containing protein n=2 Tax=uncultured Bacteroides sp. TaxID=162156 RepID=UPI002623CBCB|nr:transglutaminase domain-containing protein [uncultured Bacteroides sp.]